LTVVVDAGPLIALAKTGGLETLFRLHPRVLVPPAVRDEAILIGRERGATDALQLEEALRAGHLELATPQPRALPISALLGRGEEETILLAIDLRADWALLDDLAARQAAALSFQAAQVPTKIRGTLGIIVSAFQAGHLPLERAVHLVTRMSDRPDIWIHPRLCRQVIETLHGAAS
jgi:predicted nucleic acid-binding protein